MSGQKIRKEKVRCGRQIRSTLVPIEFRLKALCSKIPCWRCLEFLGICIGLWALLQSVEGNRLARIGLKESRVVNAWNILTYPAPGNSGKRRALETLHLANEILSGIDLSCEAMRGVENSKCVRPVYLFKLMMPNAELDKANLSGAYLRQANLSNANLTWTNLSGADLAKTNLRKSTLWNANLSNADFTEANLTGARLGGANFDGAFLAGVNLSGAKFCGPSRCAKNIQQEQIDSAWAWSDMLPIFKAQGSIPPLDLQPPIQCDPKLRKEYEKKGDWGTPTEGC